ncbi:MAG TPA: hypothetical protein VFE21_02720 [Rubrobacteraceae bacterium]|nr:hypothetical protein [Rubrobacteraceae bacterium]
MDTRDRERLSGSGGYADEPYEEEPGLGAWLQRNPWLLLRLFMVVVFTFGTSLIANQFSYGLEWNPIRLTAEQINNGELPPGAEPGDYVRITGTASAGENLTPQNIGTAESGIGVSARYSVAYFYFRLEETNDNLLIQTAQTLPDFDGEQRVWEGQLSNVGTVIFHDTTQEGLEWANLPSDRSIPVIETGDTPETYRNLFPAYSSVIVVWVLSLAWLVWKRNKPFV